MKLLQINNPRYETMRQGFKEWLITLGYSDQVVYNHPIYLIEFLSYLEARNINEIAAAPTGIVKEYFEYLQVRKNKRRSGTLSNTSVNSRIYAVEKFSEYLMKELGIFLPATIKKLPANAKSIMVLSQAEIEILYRTTESDYLGIRDRAMLSLLYGCGLRSKEAINLDISDVMFDKNLLYIRQTKNKYERLVPMTENIKNDLENYLLYSRPYLARKRPNERSFIVSRRSNRPNGDALRHRLRRLLKMSRISDYKKGISLHTLRHSIGTHLLQKGMKLDDIRQFLGHLSLESTQIYTHIVHELQ